MQLIYVERASSDDRQLMLILERRARAAERCAEANQQAGAAKAALLQHLSERLQGGADGATLRHRLVAGGIPETSSWHVMTAARALIQPVQIRRSDPAQPELPYD
jgi:hypothetical protein